MKPAIDPRDKVHEADAPAKQGYAGWERATAELGLVEAQDRETVIPIVQLQ